MGEGKQVKFEIFFKNGEIKTFAGESDDQAGVLQERAKLGEIFFVKGKVAVLIVGIGADKRHVELFEILLAADIGEGVFSFNVEDNFIFDHNFRAWNSYADCGGRQRNLRQNFPV